MPNTIKESLPKKQLKLSTFCTMYDMPRTSVTELVYRSDFPSYKLGERWYVDEERFLQWREIHNRKYSGRR